MNSRTNVSFATPGSVLAGLSLSLYQFMTNKKFVASFLFAATLNSITINSAHAAVIYSAGGSVYSQNFDSLATTGNGISWTNDTTPLPGWSLFDKNGTAKTTYNADNGTNNNSSFISYGSAASPDRALGSIIGSDSSYFASPSSGTVGGWFAVAIQNATSLTQSQFSIDFDGEQWRSSNTAPQTMTLQYGFASAGSFGSVGSWVTPGSNFDWTTLVNNNSGLVDGNAAGNVAGRGGTITGLNWVNNQVLWIRWAEFNDAGNDHGLAIDNFRFSTDPLPVPEPSTMGFAFLGLISLTILGLVAMRLRK